MLSLRIWKVIQLIYKSKKPVILCGAGVTRSKAEEQLHKLNSIIGFPVLVTRGAISLMEEKNDFFCGRPGGYGQRDANLILQSADFILILGADLSTSFTGRSPELFAPNAKKVIVLNSRGRLRIRFMSSYLKFNLDVLKFLHILFSKIQLDKIKINQEERKYWLQKCKNLRSNFKENRKIVNELDNLYDVIDNISEIIPTKSLVVIEGGIILHATNQVFKVKSGQKIISPNGMENQGYAIIAASGLRLFNVSEDEIYVLTSTYDFYNNVNYLKEIKSSKVKVIVFVINTENTNDSYSLHKMIYPFSTVGTEPIRNHRSTESLMVALGINFINVNNIDKNMIKEFIDYEKIETQVIQINVGAFQPLTPRPAFSKNKSGQWKANSLDEMEPELLLEQKLLFKKFQNG